MISNSILIAILAMAGNVEAANKYTVTASVTFTATATATVSRVVASASASAAATVTATNNNLQSASSIANAAAKSSATAKAYASALNAATAQATNYANSHTFDQDKFITNGLYDVCGTGSNSVGAYNTTARRYNFNTAGGLEAEPLGSPNCYEGSTCAKVVLTDFLSPSRLLYGVYANLCVDNGLIDYYQQMVSFDGGWEYDQRDPSALVAEYFPDFDGASKTTGYWSTCGPYITGLQSMDKPACAAGSTCKQLSASGYNVDSYLTDKKNGISPGAPGSLLLNPINPVWACVPDTVTTLRKRHSQIPTLVKRALNTPPKEGDIKVDADLSRYNGEPVYLRYTNGAWVRQ